MIRRALQILRQEGPLVLAFRVLGETVYRRMLVFETDLQTQAFTPDPHCRWLRADEAGTYALFHPVLTADEVQRRLHEGQRCWVYESADDGVVHGFWCTTGHAWLDYLQMELTLEPGHCYLYQSWTAPRHRGRGIASAAARAVKHALQLEGFTRTLACVQPDRAVVYPTQRGSGARPTAYIGWVRLGSRRWTFRRPTDHMPFYAPMPRTGTSAM